jgi:uncharacterized membrane protein YdjX (TVP38/TMEM64 family)
VTLLAAVGGAFAALESWVGANGAVGIAAFVAIFVAATLLLVPTWPFTMLAGAVFGVAWSLPLVLAAALASASTAFLLARHGLRRRAAARLQRHRVLRAIDHAVRREGWKVVLLLRLSPLVPFGMQNYAFGASAIPFTHFALATLVGIAPTTVVYLFIGAAGREALSGADPVRWTLFGAGVVATGVATFLLARATRRRLALQ